MAKMKTNHKHYSAGAVIWIIIKYFSLVFFSFVALLPLYPVSSQHSRPMQNIRAPML